MERTLTTRGYELDADGALPPQGLARYLEQVRWEALSDDGLRLGELFVDGNHMVVRAQQLRVLERVGFGVELAIDMWVGRVGRASADFRHAIRRAEDGALVARAVVTAVYVDAQGRPLRVPSLVREMAEPDEGQPLVEPPRGRAPEDAWSALMVARHSELDLLRHVNQANYLAYVQDLRWTASQAGAYGEHSRAAGGPCAGAAVEYRRQVLGGEELRLATWLLGEAPLAIGFEAVRTTDQELVFRARIEPKPS